MKYDLPYLPPEHCDRILAPGFLQAQGWDYLHVAEVDFDTQCLHIRVLPHQVLKELFKPLDPRDLPAETMMDLQLNKFAVPCRLIRLTDSGLPKNLSFCGFAKKKLTIYTNDQDLLNHRNFWDYSLPPFADKNNKILFLENYAISYYQKYKDFDNWKVMIPENNTDPIPKEELYNVEFKVDPNLYDRIHPTEPVFEFSDKKAQNGLRTLTCYVDKPRPRLFDWLNQRIIATYFDNFWELAMQETRKLNLEKKVDSIVMGDACDEHSPGVKDATSLGLSVRLDSFHVRDDIIGWGLTGDMYKYKLKFSPMVMLQSVEEQRKCILHELTHVFCGANHAHDKYFWTVYENFTGSPKEEDISYSPEAMEYDTNFYNENYAEDSDFTVDEFIDIFIRERNKQIFYQNQENADEPEKHLPYMKKTIFK